MKSNEIAAALHISREAAELWLQSDTIDLHIDSFIWSRVFGYDLHQIHHSSWNGFRFCNQLDLPRVHDVQLSGGMWSITTNPYSIRGKSSQAKIFWQNYQQLREILLEDPAVAIARNFAEYQQAKIHNRHAAFLSIQGGNAIAGDLSLLDRVDDEILRVTLVHLTTSSVGETSSPCRFLSYKTRGLRNLGKELIDVLNQKRILVDLAHISRQGFFEAVAVHDRTQPLIVTHTGVCGVYPHWRNLDDDQLRAIADSGGTVGVMFHRGFLGKRKKISAEVVVDHIAHIVNTVGEDFASIGSDFDGAIIPPDNLRTVLELPRLVDIMLRRGFSSTRVQKILGLNFLRVLRAIRG